MLLERTENLRGNIVKLRDLGQEHVHSHALEVVGLGRLVQRGEELGGRHLPVNIIIIMWYIPVLLNLSKWWTGNNSTGTSSLVWCQKEPFKIQNGAPRSSNWLPYSLLKFFLILLMCFFAVPGSEISIPNMDPEGHWIRIKYQGFGAGLFWDGSGSGNLQPGAGSW